ncbi:MAG: hypothetical protein U9N04_02275 [Patescibacteria group bacterium]|nr:hypothetical protein [Patescibacteria group bacterium]
MSNKKILYIILSILAMLIISAIFYYNLNIREEQFLDFKKGSGMFVSTDGKLSFNYPEEVQYKTSDKKTEFYIVQDCGGDIGQCGAYGFELTEGRQGDISELYKENIFYKEDLQNYYGRKDLTISNYPASQYSFCDSVNCTEDNMIHEIFIEYDNKIYSFMFGAFGTNLEQEVLNSIKFEK